MVRKVLFAPDRPNVHRADGTLADSRSDEAVLETDELRESTAPADHRPAANDIVARVDLPEACLESEDAFGRHLRKLAYQTGYLTARRLVECGYLDTEESQSILESYKFYIDDLPYQSSILDLLAFIVWIRVETREEKAVREIGRLTSMVAPATDRRVTQCSFGRLAEMPGEFYQTYPNVFRTCSTFMCPVLQAHDKDFVTVVSVNPISALVASTLIAKLIERETHVRPFTFVMSTDSNSWTFLNEKHFGA